MAVNMLQQMHASTPGWLWTPTNIEEAIQEINASVSSVSHARITSWKKRSVVNILGFIPTACKEKLFQQYTEWGWEHSFMNEDLMRQPFWKPGFKIKVADPWQTVYTVSEAVLARFCDHLSQWWKLAAPGTKAPLPEWQAAKPMRQKCADPELEGMPSAVLKLHSCCLIENWLVPACIKAFGNESPALLEDLYFFGQVVFPHGFCLDSQAWFRFHFCQQADAQSLACMVVSFLFAPACVHPPLPRTCGARATSSSWRSCKTSSSCATVELPTRH